MGSLRVLAVSHAAVVETNQEPFAALAAAGCELVVVAPRALRTDIRGRVNLTRLPTFEGELIGLEVRLGGYRRRLGGQRGIHLLVYQGLARVVARRRPDVLFVEEEPFSLAAAQCARIAARARIPFVVHENQNIDRRLAPPFAQIRRRVLASAGGVTVRNRAAESIVRGAGFAGPIGSFPHAIDPARYASATGVTGRDAGLPRPVVGFVGRVVPEKGILDLIDALAGTGASLLVIGDGPDAGPARALAEARGVPARMLGAVAHEEVPGWYAAMDVVAIPSRTTPTWMEQFGRIVIEANAAGVPVVVSDSGELPHTVAATGGGVVVPEGNVHALREALARIVGDEEERGRLGEMGRIGVRARFTHEAVARGLAAFLAEVVET